MDVDHGNVAGFRIFINLPFILKISSTKPDGPQYFTTILVFWLAGLGKIFSITTLLFQFINWFENIINNNFYFPVLEGMPLIHMSRRHNSLYLMVLAWFCNSHIHKNTGRNLLAFLLFFCVRISGR